MTQRTVGQILDELVGYTYHGVPAVTHLDVRDDLYESQHLYYRRPRLAQFDFSPYARIPVHDEPHDGVGVVALPRVTWEALALETQADLPREIDIKLIYGAAVEAW